MYLKRIKLSGFKSFVDPVSIPILSNLTGIVGPNGCGKSNIIDAVRWGIGEISAKQLRGGSMSDVIFNGSKNRSSLGQAAIELVFDNTNHKLQGEYAAYKEISIRREVNRDGASNYYLNNTSCRRKDILDLFLGTGLGSNSYAIIEQGMITQLVTAKPEELRLHLEEAAGISKYKERRRETQNRISHTKENLLRLNDICLEVEAQLQVLQKQANAANAYKKLREEERLLKTKLQILHWYENQTEFIRVVKEADHVEILLEAQIAKQRSLETTIEELQIKQHDANEELHAIQNKFYSLGTEISQLEQKTNYNNERKIQIRHDLDRLEKNRTEIYKNQTIDNDQLEMLRLEELQNQQNIDEAILSYQKAEENLKIQEAIQQEWQTKWDDFNNLENSAIQQLAVEKTRLLHLEQTLEHDLNSLERLNNEAAMLDFATLLREVEDLKVVVASLREEEQKSKTELDVVQQNITQERAKNRELGQQLDIARGNLQKNQGRKASLEVLQQNALQDHNKEIKNWLKDNGFHDKSRLAQELQVESGWEKAIELVFGDYLEAICIEDWELFPQILDSLPKNSHGKTLNFLVNNATCKNSSVSSLSLPRLTEKIKSKWNFVKELFGSVFVTENLAEALELRGNLKDSESIVTKDAIWITKTSLRVALNHDQRKSVLLNEQELRKLNEECDLTQKKLTELESFCREQQSNLLALEKQQTQSQQTFHEILQRFNEASKNLTSKQAKLQHLQQRAEQIDQDIKRLEAKLLQTKVEIENVKKSWQTLNLNQEQKEIQRKNLLDKRTECRENIDAAREIFRSRKEEFDNLQTRVLVMQNQIAHLQKNLERAANQIADFEESFLELRNSLSEITVSEEDLISNLQEKLALRVEMEKAVAQAKNTVTIVENSLRLEEKQRSMCGEEVSQIRAQLEKLRVLKQGLEVRSVGFMEQIKEYCVQAGQILNSEEDLENLFGDFLTEIENIYKIKGDHNASVDAGLKTTVSERISAIAKRIERLGAINLAAIDEYNQKKERLTYLQSQNADLVAALKTLEDVIIKIDAETKAKFKDVFTQVNTNLQALFPKIFGGGKASLQLTDDNLLETGVILTAQPPGKRNSNIQMLSGGEKALTAIALIFAIFQMNPAPFCLLDEVDAPFDDANIGRFCNLVREMSSSIQFIFISHNKLAMEMADQLLGVTMQEPGVSRIVAVDVKNYEL